MGALERNILNFNKSYIFFDSSMFIQQVHISNLVLIVDVNWLVL